MTATLPQRLDDSGVGEFLPGLLGLATALTGRADAALDLVADALTRRPALTRAALAAEFPDRRLRSIVVQQFLSRRGTGPGGLGDEAMTRRARAAVVLRDGYQLTALEIAAVLDRPAKTVIAELDAHPNPYTTEVDALVAQAPPAGDLDERLGRSVRRHRRVRARVIAVGAVIVLVIGTLIAIPTVILPSLPAPARTAGEWRFSHEVRPATGWSVVLRSITPTIETTEIKPPLEGDDPYSCWIRVFTAGVFKPEAQQVTQRLQVHSRPAMFGLTNDRDGFLAWEYGDNAWAQTYCSTLEPNSSVLQTIADMVSFGPHEVQVPFSLAALPADYSFTGLTEYPESHVVEMQLAHADIQQGDVNLVISGPLDHFGIDDAAPTTINGRQWFYTPGSEQRMCTSDAGARSLCVSGFWPGGDWPAPAPDPRNGPRQIRSMVEQVTPAADLGRTDSWPTGSQLPR